MPTSNWWWYTFFVSPHRLETAREEVLFSVFLMTCAIAVAAAQELTIQSIYAPNGLDRRAPDTIKWSPDGKKSLLFPAPGAGRQSRSLLH